MKQLILGGARSGKSRFAEHCVLANGVAHKPIYIATAARSDCDSEMLARIERHQSDRGTQWLLREEPIALGELLRQLSHTESPVLIDCLTLWLSNCLSMGCWEQQRKDFLSALEAFQGELIMVGNEVGLGIVPLGALNRIFVDESGFFHQALAKVCDRVVFVAAGLPLVMKGPPLTLDDNKS